MWLAFLDSWFSREEIGNRPLFLLRSYKVTNYKLKSILKILLCPLCKVACELWYFPSISLTLFLKVLGCNKVIVFFSLPTRSQSFNLLSRCSSTLEIFDHPNKFKSGSNNVFWATEIQGNQLIAKNVIAFFYCY